MSSKRQKREVRRIRMRRNFDEEMCEAVDVGMPVVVYGEVGKTQMVMEFWRERADCTQQPVVVDSREVMDVKVLGGFYAIRDGDVEYMKGVLVESMVSGRWIIFRRIERNQRLLQYLYTVIKYRRMVGSDGRPVEASDGFRLFLTARDKIEVDGTMCVGPVEFEFGSVMEMFLCVEVRRVVGKILEEIGNGHGSECGMEKGEECKDACPKEIGSCGAGKWCLSQGSVVCSVHFRGLIRMQKRMGEMDRLGIGERERIYQSISNVLLRHDSDWMKQVLVLAEVPGVCLHGMELAKTSGVSWGIRNLVMNIRNGEHTLMVGETGVGKTAMVEYLSRKSEFFVGRQTRLKIVNMSADFDGSDLVGGYRSVDMERAIRDVSRRLGVCVPVGWSNKEKLEYLRRVCSDGGDGVWKDGRSVAEEISVLQKLVEKKTYFVYKEGVLTEAMMNGGWVLLDEINLCSEETLDLIEALVGKCEVVLYESGRVSGVKVDPGFRVFGCMNPSGDFGKKRYESREFNVVHVHDMSLLLEDIRAVVHCILGYVVSEEKKEALGELFWEVKRKVVRRELSNVSEPLVSGRSLVRVLKYVRDNVREEVDSVIYEGFDLFVFTQFDVAGRGVVTSMFSRYFGIPRRRVEKTTTRLGFVVTYRMQMYLSVIRTAVEGRYPVLLQGDTCTGKTRMVQFLAEEEGCRVVRINNHEHTEAADYIGSFGSSEHGIRFRDGTLVQAMRRGEWIILDELNLAPSDVLEVLNRVLDDNRQIYIAETDEVVEPHPSFRIFATQNIGYGGRKGLSKAFRNRFVEVFFQPGEEGEILEIVRGVSGLPMSFCKKMVGVYENLRSKRSINTLVALRDVFKWAGRMPRTMEDVYRIGMDIIYSRQRDVCDRARVSAGFLSVFEGSVESPVCVSEDIDDEVSAALVQSGVRDYVLTDSFRRLIRLIIYGWRNSEPLLIVGETGTGKTRACDVVSSLFGTRLRTLNMHRGVESSDFIGSFGMSGPCVVWKDGPLVHAMRHGEAFLIDEINLAEDSVLERLNSVLEPSRTLYIAETGELVVGHRDFRILATMNPGGDFGKRELSPALCSRFTEIYFEIGSEELPLVLEGLLGRYFPEHGSSWDKGTILREMGEGSGMTIRKLELVVEFVHRCMSGSLEGTMYRGSLGTREIWKEAMKLVQVRGTEDERLRYYEDGEVFGVYPYFVPYRCGSVFDFETESAAANLQGILRAMGLGRGIMLEGDPGVGKTSIIQSIAKRMGKRSIRINLSEQTELSDLVGTYLPVDGGIRFVESEVVQGLREGMWIILDEINLCTQSVIEGLNSVLDYRRKLFTAEVSVDVHKETRIFGTLNPWSSRNGRKMLPRSFLDRFVRIEMRPYRAEEVEHILQKMFVEPRVVAGLGLRGNMLLNSMGMCSGDREVEYVIDKESVRIGGTVVSRGNEDRCPEFVLVHSQLEQVEMIIRCMERRIPVVVHGGVGKDTVLRFVSWVFGVDMVLVNCCKDTDTCDLLGQYQKMENGDFEWRDSGAVEGMRDGKMVVFLRPELVEKCVFDRLSSVFETERTLNIYERGIDTNLAVDPSTRFVLVVEESGRLSPALQDRCVEIRLSNKLDYVDLWKMFMKRRREMGVSYQGFCSVDGVDQPSNLLLELRRFEALGKHPKFLDRDLGGVYNALDEDEIDRMFSFERVETGEGGVDRRYLDFYRKMDVGVSGSDNDEERVQRLLDISQECGEELKVITFIKSAGLSVVKQIKHRGGCSANFPRSTKEMKVKVIECLGCRTFGEYKKLKTMFGKLCKVNWTFELSFDPWFFTFMEGCTEDPLSMVRTEMIREMNESKNRSLSRIYMTMKSMYKYGRGSVGRMVEEYETEMRRYESRIEDVERRMRRNYNEFRESLGSVDFCSYLFGDKEYYESFSDIFDYYLIYLFSRWMAGCGCSGRCKTERCDVKEMMSSVESMRDVENRRNTGEYTSNDVFQDGGQGPMNGVAYSTICVNLVRRGLEVVPHLGKVDCKRLKPEFSRYLHSLYYLKDPDARSLVMECVVLDEMVEVTESSWIDFSLEFETDEINMCLEWVFSVRTCAQVIENRSNRVMVSEEMVGMMDGEMLGLPIFTSIEDLRTMVERRMSKERRGCRMLGHGSQMKMVEEYSDDGAVPETTVVITGEEESDGKVDSGLMECIAKLYKDGSVCVVERNFRYFLYLLITPFTLEMAERYFLDCSVYEFVDRVECARELAMRDGDAVVYNVTLRYVAFDVDRRYNEKIRRARSKLRREPGQYMEILEELRRFLIQPVTNVLELRFPEPGPGCTGIHPDVYTYMLLERTLCECNDWIRESHRLCRQEVGRRLRGRNVDKRSVMESFYSRVPEEMFSETERCLGKVVNQIVEDVAVVKLTQMCIDNPYIPFMYFVFVFGQSSEETVEEGTGMKSGTGNVNISEEVKEEEEIGDEYGEDDKVSESDGIDFENGGSISTVSGDGESECSSGVDASDSDRSSGSEEDCGVEDKVNVEEGNGEENPEAGDGVEVPDEENISDSGEAEEREESQEDVLEDGSSNEEMDTRSEFNKYEFSEGRLNQNQTCGKADNYERYVAGDKVDERALCSGPGEETVSGEDERGEGRPGECTVRIRMEEPDCSRLTNLLRNVMECNRSSRYRGDFKSGKKLNMKRLIPYIASGYRRDRIWMKRQTNEKKECTLRLFVDNSRSMYSQEMIDTLLSVYSKISRSFSLLGIPVEVYRFGRTVERSPIEEMRFDDTQTTVEWVDEFDDGINVVLTDGVFQNAGYHKPNFLVLLIDKCDVRKMSRVTVSEGSVFVQKYLDTFPFKYCIITDVGELESVFVTALSELIGH